MSLRNVNRYVAVARSPVEIQKAFRVGRLKLGQAAPLAGLHPLRLDEVAVRHGQGGAPAAVACSVLRPVTPGKGWFTRYVAALRKALEAHHEEPTALPAHDRARCEEVLARVRRLIDVQLGGVECEAAY